MSDPVPTLMARGTSFLVALALGAAATMSAGARADAGRIEAVSGEVEILRTSEKPVPARTGFVLQEGDAIRTGADGRADLHMRDDARLAVRPNTRLRLDAYRFEAGDASAGRSIIALVRGALRSITGAIGRNNKDNYRINTPSATIGIRGTDHETAFVPPDDPDFRGIDPGTYNLVFEGGTFIEANSQRLDLTVDESGFAGLDPKQAPIRLREAPAFMRSNVANNSGKSSDASSESGRNREAKRDRSRDRENDRKDTRERKRDD
jgi:hypothetical protein